MSNVICIQGETLAAALLCAPKDDVRYYLNGCLIESNPTTTRMVVTSGHYLYAEDCETENTFTGSLIIPHATLGLAKAKSGFWYIDVGHAQNESGPYHNYIGCTLRDASGAINIRFDSVAARFPDYCRVMPSGPFDGQAATINPAYVALAHKVTRLTNKDGLFKTFYNGPNNAVLANLPRGVMVIMPIRSEGDCPDVSRFKSPLFSTETV